MKTTQNALGYIAHVLAFSNSDEAKKSAIQPERTSDETSTGTEHAVSPLPFAEPDDCSFSVHTSTHVGDPEVGRAEVDGAGRRPASLMSSCIMILESKDKTHSS